MMDPIIDPPPVCLSDMLIVGHSMTSYTIGEIRKLEADLAAAQADLQARTDHLTICKSERQAAWDELAAARAEAAALRNPVAIPLADWHEDDGPVLWWRMPVCEPPWCGSPLDEDWEDGYYTHFTRLVCPVDAAIDAVRGAAHD